MKILLLISILLVGCGLNALHAQRAFFTNGNQVYELTGSTGSCGYKNWGHFCIADSGLFSLAMHKDTLYMLTNSAQLYRVDLTTGSCGYVADLGRAGTSPSLSALTCDKNGILYGIDGFSKSLYRYDPHTDQLDILGTLPALPTGDMLFYGDTLLYAANLFAPGGFVQNIYAVDIDNPAASQPFMPTPGYFFYGLIALPADCSRNRLYGLTSEYPARLIELDPVNHVIVGPICQFPFGILDAASTLEDGSLARLFIDSLAIQAACGPSTTGSLQVFASSAGEDATTYTLDGGPANTTGSFSNIPTGIHSIHIQSVSSAGCSADTTFIMGQGLSDNVQYQVTNPLDCSHKDGSIGITASSQSLPVLYSLNGSTPQTTPVFDHLGAGHYTLSITDAGHCEKDTSFVLSNQQYPPFLGPITVTPTVCAGKSGNISVALTGNTDPSTVSVSLNQGPVRSSQSLPGLDAGIDTLHVYNTDGCRYDTIVTIIREVNPEPVIRADVGNQVCFADNGSIHLSINGADGPYLTSVNNAAYTANLRYDELGPATYTISIRDKNVCGWDTAFTIEPYPKEPVTLAIDTVNPDCMELNSGSVTIDVRGDQSPYWLRFNNATYASGTTIDHLNYGNYSLPVINRDGCVVDSAQVHLDLDLKPECNTIYLPNAFSPNGNGVNDLFRIIHTPYLTQIQFRVFNRYGELLFTSSDQRPGWDGTFHGVAQPAGTYVWTAGYTNLNNEKKTASGTVLLIR